MRRRWTDAYSMTVNTNSIPATRPERRLQKAALTLGYLALAIGTLTTVRAPATEYQLSIYRSMPTGFWIGVGIALLTAVVITVRADESSRVRDAALGLLAFGAVSVFALPVLRSYYFYGAGDALSHLGWAREIQQGAMGPAELVYPGVHLLSIQFAEVAGVPLRSAMQLLVLVGIPLVFVVASAACVYQITHRQRDAALGALVGAMFVPVNNVSVHPVVHPSSQAILLFPVVLLCVLLFLQEDASGFALATPTGALLALVSAGYVFVHPQESMTYLSMLVGISLLQFFVRRFRSGHPIASFRPLYVHAVIVGVVFATWTQLHERARSRFTAVTQSLLAREPSVLESTGARGASLVDLGGSLFELYLKLFSVSTLLLILAGVLALAAIVGLLDRDRGRRNGLLTVLSFALVFPGVGLVVIFLAQQGDHYFRFLGFIMVTVSLLGAVAMGLAVDRLRDTVGGGGSVVTREAATTALSAVFVLLLALQLVAVHPSPYIYQPNDRVTEPVMDGYDRALTYHDGETSLTGVRSGPSRYVDALYGTSAASEQLFPGYRSDVPEVIFNTNVTSHYEDDRYLIVTTKTRKKEVRLYDGLRYRSTGFEALETEPGAHRIQDNGGFTLYRLAGTDD